VGLRDNYDNNHSSRRTSNGNKMFNGNSSRKFKGSSNSGTFNGNSNSEKWRGPRSSRKHPGLSPRQPSGRMDLRDNYDNNRRMSPGNKTFNGSNSRMSRGSSRTFSANSNKKSDGNSSKKFNASSNSKMCDGNNRRRRSHRHRNGRMCPQDDNSPKWHGRPRNSPGPQQVSSSSARLEGTKRALQTRMRRNLTGESASRVRLSPRMVSTRS